MNIYIQKFKNKEVLMELLFVISLAMSFFTRIGKLYNVNYFVKIIIATIWVLIGCYVLIKKGQSNQNIRIFKLFVYPLMALLGYNFLLIVLGKVEPIYYGRMISNLYSMIIVVLFSISSLIIFKEKTLKLVIYATLTNIVFLLIINVFLYGIDPFYQLFLSIVGDVEATNPFEVHDLTFGVAILAFFLIAYKSNSIQYKLSLVLLILFMFLGYKRIQMLTLLICLILYLIIRKLDKEKSVNFMKFVFYAFIICCFIFIIMIKFGYLEHICNLLDIETMGRLALYKWISQYYHFTPAYLGIGIGVTFKMTELLTTWGIEALHSDILRMYVEIGFIGFFCWIYYYLIFLLNKFKKILDYKNLIIFFFATIYLFVLHLTDNTVLYFATQFIYTTIIMYTLIYNKEVKIFSKCIIKENNVQ